MRSPQRTSPLDWDHPRFDEPIGAATSRRFDEWEKRYHLWKTGEELPPGATHWPEESRQRTDLKPHLIDIFSNADYRSSGNVPVAYIHELLGLMAQKHPLVEELREDLEAHGHESTDISRDEYVRAVEGWAAERVHSAEEQHGAAMMRAREKEALARQQLEQIKHQRDTPHSAGGARCKGGGSLEVLVREAKGLAEKDFFVFRSDPFLTLHVGQQRFQTRTVHENTNPVWDETFTIRLEAPAQETLELNLYDDDSDSLWSQVTGEELLIGQLAAP